MIQRELNRIALDLDQQVRNYLRNCNSIDQEGIEAITPGNDSQVDKLSFRILSWPLREEVNIFKSKISGQIPSPDALFPILSTVSTIWENFQSQNIDSQHLQTISNLILPMKNLEEQFKKLVAKEQSALPIDRLNAIIGESDGKCTIVDLVRIINAKEGVDLNNLEDFVYRGGQILTLSNYSQKSPLQLNSEHDYFIFEESLSNIFEKILEKNSVKKIHVSNQKQEAGINDILLEGFEVISSPLTHEQEEQAFEEELASYKELFLSNAPLIVLIPNSSKMAGQFIKKILSLKDEREFFNIKLILSDLSEEDKKGLTENLESKIHFDNIQMLESFITI